MPDPDARQRDAPRRDAPPAGGTPPSVRSPAPPPDWQLWLSLTGAPVLWLLHFLIFYLAVEMLCFLESGATLSRWALGGGTLVFAAGALAFSIAAYRIGRRAVRSSQVYDDFLPRVGIIIGLMATFALLMESLPLLFVSICA